MEGAANLATGNAVSALLFVSSMSNAIDVFSATNSSPWTAENFGGDEEKVSSLREYVIHACILTGITNGVGSVIARNAWPLLGAATASLYMVWLYERAVKRGMEAGSDGWQNQS